MMQVGQMGRNDNPPAASVAIHTAVCNFCTLGAKERFCCYMVAHRGLYHAITVDTVILPGEWWPDDPNGELPDSHLVADEGAKEIAHRVYYDRTANEWGFALRPRANGPFLGWLTVDA
jgi:hypothetical protein